MTDARPLARVSPRPTWRGAAVAALVWALYTAAYAVAVAVFAGVPLVYAVQSQVLSSGILAALSVPVWFGIVRGLDGHPARQLAAHAAAMPAYAVGGTALYVGAYAAGGVEGAVAVLAERFGWIALGAATLYVAQFAVYHGVAASQRARRERAAAERLRARTREQELRSLRSQLHPHFLFNALTAISAEVGRDPDQARERIGQLAGLLRYSLDAGRRDAVPLAEELAFVRDYLALESARMGDRLRATVDVDDAALGAEVPPMALQTLVENAVRHGVAPLAEGGAVAVTVRAEVGDPARGGGAAVVTVEDTGVGATAAALAASPGPGPGGTQTAGGVGLANTDERLRLLFGTGLDVEAHRDVGFAVTFRVPLPDASPPERAVRRVPAAPPAT